ncbi:hypothetical protein AJL15_13015 [Listeria monocytogenes]|nr:hypothetical protein AJL15_13015 [Listeria monocytogenes]
MRFLSSHFAPPNILFVFAFKLSIVRAKANCNATPKTTMNNPFSLDLSISKKLIPYRSKDEKNDPAKFLSKAKLTSFPAMIY